MIDAASHLQLDPLAQVGGKVADIDAGVDVGQQHGAR